MKFVLIFMIILALGFAQLFSSEEESPSIELELIQDTIPVIEIDPDLTEFAEDSIEEQELNGDLQEETSTTTTTAVLAERTKTNWREASLRLHNKFRSRHGSPPLRLSDDLNKSAQECAEYLASRRIFKHVCHYIFGHDYGENLNRNFENNSTKAAADAVTSWYINERPKYDYNKAQFSFDTGHFTQVVWKNSKKLGLGYAKNGNYKVVVAHYDPPGNVIGYFKQNVKRHSFSNQ